MELEQLFRDFQYDDLQWFIPVMAGLFIIVGGLLIGIIRGMTAGVLLGLFFGGLMCLSPVLLNTLQAQQTRAVDPVSSDVAKSVALLSELNNDVVVDISRAIATMRFALDGLRPVVENDADLDRAAVLERYEQSLSDVEERLNAALASMQSSGELRTRLAADVRRMEDEVRRAMNGQ